MKLREATYLAHRWLGLVIALQLLACSTRGLVFSVLDIRAVRGELDSTAPAERPLGKDALEALPEPIGSVLEQSGARRPNRLELTDRGLGPHWEARNAEGALLARITLDGRLTASLTAEEATKLALRDFVHNSKVSAIELIESDAPTEYRGRPLPAYRVELDHRVLGHLIPAETWVYPHILQRLVEAVEVCLELEDPVAERTGRIEYRVTV